MELFHLTQQTAVSQPFSMSSIAFMGNPMVVVCCLIRTLLMEH